MGNPLTVHPDAGRNDYISPEEYLMDDEDGNDRAADYRVGLIHDWGELDHIAALLSDSRALSALVNISQVDPAEAGNLFSQICADLIDKRANEHADNDNGVLIEFPRARDIQDYLMAFEQFRDEMRKGK